MTMVGINFSKPDIVVFPIWYVNMSFEGFASGKQVHMMSEPDKRSSCIPHT